ncbi:MAG: hypothetical protein EOO16_06060 [Chitinophagaceae bacterium]|nr:MAG: hypothetical protein EOO16_06060 [Chitinophagaceae bacterium]
MEETKIQFSPAEMNLMCDAGVILTKNKILYGIRRLLEGLQAEMERAVYGADPGPLAEVLGPSAKISKGENYLGLPYLVLDYPRSFDSRNIFALRTLFWWGNSFSSTLHLSGVYREIFSADIAANYHLLAKHNYFIGINEEDPWQHHFEEDNYRAVALMNEGAFSDRVERAEHLKIAVEYSLRDVHFVSDDLLESWKRLLGVCGMKFRGDEW